jgi:hypothetical protein
LIGLWVEHNLLKFCLLLLQDGILSIQSVPRPISASVSL